MAALNWNDLSETPPNAVNWDELSDTPPKETSVPERVVNTGQALGRLAKDLPTHSLAYAANIKEGSRPLDKNDWADKATEDSSKLLNERLSASDANDKTLLGTKGDWAQTSASLPFSMGSIPAAIGAGGLATVVTKNPIAGYSAGATASGALAYRADSAMFMNSALNTFKDKYKAENNGVEPSQELMLAEQERLQPYAEDHGLWEAIPEGLGSAIGGKVVSSAFKNAGENLAVKAGKVIAGLAAEEMPSETVSQQGQYNTEIDAGVSEGEKRSFTSPSDIAQSVSEVAIPVAQQSLLMGGAAGVTSKAYDYAKERARKLQETAKTGTLGRSIAAGDIAATDTVIQPDIEEKYAAPKANPAEQIENVDTEPAFEKRNSPYNDLFDAATIKHNLPDGLLNKIGHVESGFNPDAISPAGARGVMQFMPRTANEYGIDPHDAPAAIDAAGKKMAHLRDYYDGNITKAIAAYNYGEGNLNEVIDNHGDQWREHLPTETTNYLNKIIGGSNESKSSRVDSGSRSTNDALATTVNKIKEEEPDYSSLSLDELENLHKKAIDANNDIDYEAIKKHLGEDEADNFLKLSERQKGNWWEKNADTAMEDDSSAFHGIDSDKILAHINAKNDFDIESPESLGRSIAFKMMNISSPDFKGSPDHTAIKSALEYAQDKGWDTQKIIKSARNKATEIAGADAPELFDTLFKKVENKANSEPIIKEQPKAIADQVTPIQLKENKLKSANDEKVEVKYGKNTFHVLKSELDSDAPILAAFNVKSGKQASFKLKRDKIELKDDQPTTITGNDAANGSDAERANGATDTGGAAQESNKGLTNPAQAATQPTETINGSKESTNEKRSLPTQEQERPLLNNEAPVQSGALSSGEFNPILKTKKTTWVKNRLKELQVKEGTAGYAKRLKEVQAEHANELEKAQASLPYEQFKALPDNEGIPDSLVRQAYDVLREDHGITTLIDTQAHESATSPNNDLPAPTPAQIEAGNYKKGHINLHGLDISIENPKGSTRSGTDKDGTPWENTMTSHYGYIKGSIGADKEHVDVFVGDNYGSDKAFVVNQNHPHNGKFDEHKVMLGFDTAEQAKEGYLKNYVDGWKGLGSITEIPVSELKDRIKSGALTKPIANSIAKTDESNGVSNKNDQFGEADLPKFIQNIDKHRRDLFGVDDHINKANTLLPFTESTIGDHPSIEHAVDFLNRRTDAYKHFDGRLLKGGSASQSLSLKDDLLPNWSQAKQIERSFEEWKKKYPGQAQKLKENLQNVLNLNKGDKVLFPNHGAKEGDPVHDTGEILKKNPKNWIIKSKNGVELHFQPSALKPVSGNYNSHIENAIEPVVEDSQVDNSRLEKKSDQKPETKQYHPAIESLSNDLVEYGKANKVFTEDAANAARERLKAKLGRLNSGFDPEMMLDGMTLAGYHIEAGAKQYGAYAKAMIADLGEGIKPYLAHFYNAVRDYPGFDNKDMASYASLEASKKIGVYPGENWRYKNQQAREVTQVNEHYITFATRDNDGRDQESISNFIASKKGFNDVFWKDQTSDKADVKGEEAPGHYDAAIELERDPVRKRKLEIERDLSQASAKTNNLEKQVSNLAKRIKSVTESKTQYENANQGIDTREAPKYEDQTDAERKKSLAAWKQRQADQRALNVKRIGDLTEDLKTLEESKAQRIEELEAHKAHIASIRNQYVVNGVVNLDAIKNGGNQDAVLFSKSTETPSNTHTKQSLSSAIKSIMDKAFGDGWTNRLLSTDKFKIISRDEAVSIAGEKASDAKGFYDPKTDTTFLVADNISQNTTPEEIEGLLYHEIASHALKLGKSSAEFKSILARFEKLKAIDANIQAAFDRVPKDTNPEHVTEEALSYYLEKNPRSTLGKRVIEWFRQAIRAIGNTLVGKDKYLFSKWANELTHTELVNMANKALKSAHDSLLFDNVGRENEAVKISQSAMKSVEANIKRGREAMTNALLNKSTVHRAMFRQGMGWVDFVWGDAGGSITSKGKRPGAKGISHIIEARQRKDGLSNQQAEKMLFDLVDTIAKGQEVNRYESALSTSIKINYHDNQVLLARRNGSNAWIVTGFEIHEPVDVGSGYDAPTPTQSTSTLTRNELGAGEETIAQDNGKSNDNDIKFSKFEPSVGEHYTLPAETKPRHQQRLWQDMNNRWTVIQDVIKKAGGVINDANNVYQAMELMPSKAGERIRDYRDTYITPLYDRMTKAGVTLNDLALFNYATHAEERNLAMSKINPRFSIDNGSGMTNQEAIDTLEELKLHYGGRFGELEKLAKEFRAITDDTLNILVDAGVMTQDAVDKMRATYQNYVPLKGFEKVDENGNQTNGSGLGHSTGKAFSKRALGRESKAGQIIENIIRDHERAIVWAEKTEVAKTLGNFVQDFPDDKLWTLQKISLKPTLTPGKREFFLFYSGSFVGKAKTAKDMRRFRDAEIARTGQDKKDYRINVIKADDKVGARPEPFDPEKEARYIQYGKEVRIQIHDLLALKAFNKLGDQSENEIFRLAGVMNSFLRQMWTQKNPAFFLINPIRDVQTASIYLTGEGGVTLAGKAIKNWSSSWFTMWNHARNKQSSPTEQAILDRYRKSGGMVGTAYISSLDKINEDIHHQLQRFGGEQIQDLISAGKIREAVSSIGFRVLNNKLFDGIENLNTAFECATRLATFKAAVESGYTDKQAAALALNVTVNFTKKGEYGRELGAMYLFANANIQGNANVFKTLTQSNYRGQAWAIAGSLAVLGFMAAMAVGDDGEDELIGDYEKERNLIFDLGEGKRFTIPVAYGWSIFMDLGRAMARAMNGGDTEAISKKLASSFLGNFSPIGNPIPNGELSADNAIVAFAPTFSKPFVMPAVNKTSFGTPLMPESPFKPNQPDSEKVYRKTRGTLYDSAAETLNSVTGGDAVQSGWIDVSPETLKNTWNYLLGGAGRFITDTESMAQTALSVNEESKPESWPIVKTFYKSESIDDYRRRYYEQADRIVKANEQFSAYKKAGEIDKAKEMIRDNGNLIRLKVYSSGVRDKLKSIRDKEDEIRKAGGDIRLLNALESRERKILSDFSVIAAR